MKDTMNDKDISDQLMHLDGPERHIKSKEELRDCYKWFHEPNLANNPESPGYAKEKLSMTRKGRVIHGEELNGLGERIFQEQYEQRDPVTGNYE